MRGGAVPVYRGYSSQYRAGLGNVLGGLVRAAVPKITPLLSKGAHSLLNFGLTQANENAHHLLQKVLNKGTNKVREAVHLPAVYPSAPVKRKRKSRTQSFSSRRARRPVVASKRRKRDALS